MGNRSRWKRRYLNQIGLQFNLSADCNETANIDVKKLNSLKQCLTETLQSVCSPSPKLRIAVIVVKKTQTCPQRVQLKQNSTSVSLLQASTDKKKSYA